MPISFLQSVNSHIKLESHNLTKRILREVLFANLKNSNLLIRNCRFIIFVNVLLKMSFDIGNTVLFLSFFTVLNYTTPVIY